MDTSKPTSGPAQAADSQKKNWPIAARHVVLEITELFNSCATTHDLDELIDSDYSKLLQAAEKLEDITVKEERGEITEHQKTWHNLRNIIGTIQGYIELIQEEQNIDDKINHQLSNVYRLSVQLLELGEHSSLQVNSPRRKRSKSTSGTILIIDDQQESREVLRRHLQHDHHRVLEAASGKQMLSILERDEVDLILLDLVLPEMDGHELLARLKRNEAWRAIPVIVVSGNKDTDGVIRCIEAGAEDYLFKPFNPVLLQARISAGVERKRWYDREQQYRDELEKNQQFIRHIFGRYVSEEIVTSLLENPDGLDLGGTHCKATIMMADIRGFTPIAEKLPPQQVVRLLNNYLGAMSEIIMEHNGTVNEFIGDAILAIFGAPVNRDDDSDRAIQCAIAMQEAIKGINQQNLAEDLPPIEIGISLNTGPVIAGNIGSLKRTKYGVVGHTVNQTARIEDACPAGKILISESTLIDSETMLSISHSQTIQAKGIHKAINIYQLNAASPLES